MTTTLITGANRSLGLETARRLLEAGHTVYAGMRDTADGDAARALGIERANLYRKARQLGIPLRREGAAEGRVPG